MIAGGIIGGFSAKGVTFSGDYLSRSSIAGLADSKTGLISTWIKGSAGSLQFLVYDGRFRVYVFSPKFQIVGMNSSGTIILNLSTSVAINDGSWHHILAAWDTSTSTKTKIYLDGSDVTSISALSNSNVDYGNSAFEIGSVNSSPDFSGELAEFYFTTQWADLTDAAVRAKFAKNGKPVSLGSDGSKPTGTAPLIYLQGPASNWGVNAGTGGNFSVSGSFSDAATKPSY